MGIKNGVFLAKLNDLINWGRKGALWPLAFATACCGIEMMAAAASRYDFDRFGVIFRNTPRQCDLLIMCGTISRKMAPIIKRLWDQMPDPKWAIAVGSCAISGNIFQTYSTLRGLDCIVPVDVYIPGCAPKPEAFYEALIMLQEKIKRDKPIIVGGEECST